MITDRSIRNISMQLEPISAVTEGSDLDLESGLEIDLSQGSQPPEQRLFPTNVPNIHPVLVICGVEVLNIGPHFRQFLTGFLSAVVVNICMVLLSLWSTLPK